MILGVVSDTHGSLLWWRKAYEYLKDADAIIHCGDVFYHGVKNPIPEGYDTLGLAQALNEIRVPLLIAKGNCDSSVDQVVLDFPMSSGMASIHTPGGVVLAQHGDVADRSVQEKWVRRAHLAAFVSGHTHIPKIEKVGDAVLMNPGSVSIPLGGSFRSVGKLILDCNRRCATVFNLEASCTAVEEEF
ncbi:MAG TPA: phosphodiesterase [bacterium]|nr:phosphodiesterase [bacterium]